MYDKAELEAVLQAEISQAIQQLKEYIDKRSHDVETCLLLAFSDYQVAESIRFRT